MPAAAHPGEIAGYDPTRPALSQLDRLSDEQIRAVAAGLDPWAGGVRAPAPGRGASAAG